MHACDGCDVTLHTQLVDLFPQLSVKLPFPVDRSTRYEVQDGTLPWSVSSSRIDRFGVFVVFQGCLLATGRGGTV